MDHKVLTYLLFVFLTISLHHVSESKKVIALSIGEDKEHTDTYTLLLGIDGIPGKDGPKGDQGLPGFDGILGKDGPKGDQGSLDTPGRDGMDGIPRAPGIDGIPGKYGPKGDQGFPGFDGSPGKDGPKGDQGSPGMPGRDGKDGMPGLPGIDGIPGKVGLRGHEGLPGLDGFPGEDGPKGDQGYPGMPGRDGKDGIPGPPGNHGIPGKDGLKGDQGLPGAPGLPGPVGPPGLAGMPAIYPCSLPKITRIIPVEYEPESFARKYTPAIVPCKAAPEGFESGEAYMGPDSQAFKVYCNMTSRETCIRRDIQTREISHTDGNGTYWLSGMQINLIDLYNLTTEQVTWLQQHSVSARQTIKYYCLNSVPFPKFNVSASVKLLTWNEALIGPYPTDKTPFFYSIPTATDHCKEGNTEWQSSIIELQTTNTFRLPVIDLWIGDIRDGDQRMYLESTELCFG